MIDLYLSLIYLDIYFFYIYNALLLYFVMLAALDESEISNMYLNKISTPPNQAASSQSHRSNSSSIRQLHAHTAQPRTNHPDPLSQPYLYRHCDIEYSEDKNNYYTTYRWNSHRSSQLNDQISNYYKTRQKHQQPSHTPENPYARPQPHTQAQTRHPSMFNLSPFNTRYHGRLDIDPETQLIDLYLGFDASEVSKFKKKKRISLFDCCLCFKRKKKSAEKFKSDLLPNIAQQYFCTLANQLSEHPQLLKDEGIFRKSGNQIKVNQALKALAKNQKVKVVEGLTLDDYGLLMKQLFQLSIGYDLRESFKEYQAGTSTELHPYLVKVCQFLNHVSRFENDNKMSALNLATCFAPNFIDPNQSASVEGFEQVQVFIQSMATLIQNHGISTQSPPSPQPSPRVDVQSPRRQPRAQNLSFSTPSSSSRPTSVQSHSSSIRMGQIQHDDVYEVRARIRFT